MNRGHPTRLVKTMINANETMQERIIGASHVGRRAIEANVSLGLKKTPPIRAIEFSDDSGIAVVVLDIFHPSMVPAAHSNMRLADALFRAVYSKSNSRGKYQSGWQLLG
jgi:hypothetical protein